MKNAKVPGYIGPQLDLALDYIRSSPEFDMLPRMEFFWGDTKCDVKVTMDLVFHYVLDEPVHAFIGPLCTFPLATASRIIGSRFRRPVVTFAGGENDFADKSTYPLLARVGGTYATLIDALNTTFLYFGWKPREHKNIALLHVRVDEATAESQNISKQIVAASEFAYFIAKSILHESFGDFKVEGIITQFGDEDDLRARMRQISYYGRSKNFIRGKSSFWDFWFIPRML